MFYCLHAAMRTSVFFALSIVIVPPAPKLTVNWAGFPAVTRPARRGGQNSQ